MPKSESPFVRCFRLEFIVEKEQEKVRKAILKTRDNNEIIRLTYRYDDLQKRKELIRKLKFNY